MHVFSRARTVAAVLVAGALLPTSAAAEVRDQRLDSPALGGPVRVVTVTPDDRRTGERLPLVLLLHGAGGDAGTWLHPAKGDAVGLARRHRAVYVTFDAGRSFYSDPYGGGPAYERFVLEELLPWLRRTAGLANGRGNRTVVGTSMGGFGALLLAARRPDVFGRAASLSGFVQPERPTTYPGLRASGADPDRTWGPAGGPYLAGHNPTRLLDVLAPVRLYLSAGDGTPSAGDLDREATSLAAKVVNEREVRAQAEELVDAAEDRVTWRPTAGVHGWTTWRAAVDGLLSWGLSGPVAPKPADWAYQTVAQAGRAWDVVFRFDDRPGCVVRFQRRGSQLRGTGCGRVRLTVAGRSVRRSFPFVLDVRRLAGARTASRGAVLQGRGAERQRGDRPAQAGGGVGEGVPPEQR